MDMIDFSQETLPPIRGDLEIIDGGRFVDGSQRWMIYDHVPDSFIELDDIALRVFRGLDESIEFTRLLKSVQAYVSGFSADDLNNILNFFLQENLLHNDNPLVSAQKIKRVSEPKQHWSKRLLHNYLFIKIPLLDPEPWIGHVANKLVWLRSAPIDVLRILLVLYAFSILITRTTELKSTFVEHLSLNWLILLFFGIALLKVLHEFAHAIAAKWRGVKVSQIGMAFLVLFPILYTDSTDAWRLKDPKERRRISLAGVFAELHVAAIALVIWSILPEGWLKSFCFALFLGGLLPSLLVNLNPLMRFDAYYWLSDYWGVANLQARSFEVGKSVMRHRMFGFPKTFTGFNEAMEFKLSVYCYAVWIYRFFLFLGIAILVYSIDFKLLGVLLFVVEIWVFIAKPVFKELSFVWQQRAHYTPTPFAGMMSLFIAMLGYYVLGANHQSLTTQAIASPAQELRYFAPEAGQLQFFSEYPQRVDRDTPLVTLSSPQKQLSLQKAQLDLDTEQSIYDAVLRGGLGKEIESSRQRIVSAKRTLQDNEDRIALNHMQANFTGQWWPNPELERNDRVQKGTELGILVNLETTKLAFLVQDWIQLPPETDFSFIAENGVEITGRASVKRSATPDTQIIHPLLASALGGIIPARQEGPNDEWQMLQAKYIVTLELDEPFLAQSIMRGFIKLSATSPPRAKIWLGRIFNDLNAELQW